MNKTAKLIAVLLSAVLSVGTFAFAAPGRGEKVTVIVEVKGGAVLEAETAREMGFKLFSETDKAAQIESGIRLAQAEVQSGIKQSIEPKAEIIYTYTHVFNGFSMEIYESEIEEIKALPNVENVYVSKTYELYDDPAAPAPYLDSGCTMMQTGYMHDLGYTGKGMVIAIVDSGFDTSHENFQGSITNARLSKADIADKIESGGLSINALGGNATVNRVYRSEKIPYAYNYYKRNSDTYDPTSNHGQHVAGIAAGNNGTDPNGNKFVGTAPDAQLLLMSCGEGSGISEAASIAAIDDAVKLGADVINASYGDTYQEEYTAEEKAINTAVNAGVLFSAAAGNEARGYNEATPKAENIDYSASGTPNGFTASTAVASAENTDIWEKYYTMTVGAEELRCGDENSRYSFATRFSGGEYEYVYVGYGKTEDYEGKDAAGKIALIDRGSAPGEPPMFFSDKIANAKSAGVSGVIFVNTAEPVNIGIMQSSLQDMPTAVVSHSDGEILKTATIKKLQTDTELKNGLSHSDTIIMSDFSSWNTDSSLELKPEITAPGGNIYSSVHDDQYEIKSGTSMAAPHMTGAAALMKEYITKNTSKYGTVENPARLVENLIMTSADVIMQDTENNIPYSPRLQGAGMVNLEKAAKTPVTLIGDVYDAGGMKIEKSKISLGEVYENNDFTFTARNLTDTDVTYDSITMTVITDSADENGIVGDMKKLTFNAGLPESVTVPANDETEITIPVTLDKTDLGENMEVFTNGFFIDGYVFLENTTDAEIPEISLPFMGFYGGWDSAPALDKTYFSGESVLKGTYMYTTSNRNTNGSYAGSRTQKIMGTNWFTTGKEEDIDDYESEYYVGYSPNDDSAADNPAAVAMPLRKLGKTDYAIYDEAGVELLRETDMDNNEYYCADKFSETYFYFSEDEINALPDGDYTFKVYSGFIRSEHELGEDISFKFYLDRKKPVITKFEKSDDGKALTVAATDNRHLMGFVVSGTKMGERYYKSYPIKALSEYETTVDITGIDEGTLSVEVVDYAQNSTKRTDSGLNFVYSGVSGSSRMFVVSNSTEGEITAAITMALYNGGALVGVSSKNETILTGNSVMVFNAEDVPYDTIKIFVWDSLEGMVPLHNAFEF